MALAAGVNRTVRPFSSTTAVPPVTPASSTVRRSALSLSTSVSLPSTSMSFGVSSSVVALSFTATGASFTAFTVDRKVRLVLSPGGVPASVTVTVTFAVPEALPAGVNRTAPTFCGLV